MEFYPIRGKGENMLTYHQIYYKKNKERLKIAHKEYREENREEISEYNRLLYLSWLENNPDYIKYKKECAARWTKENPEKKARSQKKYRRNNRDKINAANRERYKKQKIIQENS